MGTWTGFFFFFFPLFWAVLGAFWTGGAGAGLAFCFLGGACGAFDPLGFGSGATSGARGVGRGLALGTAGRGAALSRSLWRKPPPGRSWGRSVCFPDGGALRKRSRSRSPNRCALRERERSLERSLSRPPYRRVLRERDRSLERSLSRSPYRQALRERERSHERSLERSLERSRYRRALRERERSRSSSRRSLTGGLASAPLSRRLPSGRRNLRPYVSAELLAELWAISRLMCSKKKSTLCSSHSYPVRVVGGRKGRVKGQPGNSRLKHILSTSIK